MNRRISTRLRVVAGPDAGRLLALETGRHVIGRVAGPAQISDPALEAHHALLDVGSDGPLRILQLTGRFPIRVDGRPTDEWTKLRRGSVIELGQSRLHVEGPDVESPRDRPVRCGLVELGRPLDRLGDDPDVDRPASCDIDLAAFDRIAIEGPHAQAVAAAIGRQLAGSPVWNVTSLVDVQGFVSVPSQRAVRQLIVCRVSDVTRYASLWDRSDVSALVLVAPGNRVPAWCRSLLVVGATWHGEWWPDRHGSVTDVERLHVRGTRRPLPPVVPDLPPAAQRRTIRTARHARCAASPERTHRYAFPLSGCRELPLGVRRSRGIGVRLRAPPPRRRGSTVRMT